ncbi:MAG: ribosome-associated translation inhibitor RaiA [Luteitalea sp.]|nr:ribosome-associated translation inhibitor RaiA [Luteitalea sp.]
MRVALTGRNVEITPSLRQLVGRRLKRLERLLNDSALSAQVVLKREKYRHLTDITLHTREDHILKGFGNDGTWPQSVSVAVEKVMQQAHKVKERWDDRKRRARRERSVTATVTPPEEAPAASWPRIVRARRYAVKPMRVEDAALAVADEANAFLVFRNAETDEVTILYRRKDGHLGLIEP